MGAMGKYIATLSVEQRDRLVQATAWCNYTFRRTDGAGCLIEHAEPGRGESEDLPYHMKRTAGTYDIACHSLGRDRVVRAIKLRAARLNGCSPEAIRALTTPHEQPQSVP